jgi:acyl carrier protein
VLIDTDGTAESAAAVPAAVASGEPQVALRGGQVLVPRLGRVPLPGPAAGPGAPELGSGPVLVTGGTGTLGSLVARHLVPRHGVRDLVLASRRGPGAAGAGQLAADLAGLGAQVQVTACDTADRDALAGLIGRDRPLAGVVHCAGALDDGTVGSLTAGRLDTALAPKADAAWHLHELTAGMNLAMFALFSSAAGVLGAPGQANYAAANAFLDALAAWRTGQGLPGLSLAWGFWEQASGMTGHLDQQDLARLRRAAIAPLPTARALTLFDAGITSPHPAVIAARFDTPALSSLARTGTLPTMLSGLLREPVKAPSAPDGGGIALARQLGGLDDSGRRRLLLDIVCGQAAAVLGHGGPGGVTADQAFRDAGFDSLSAVDLRNRLNAATGLRLPTTLVFDYPTPAVLAAYLLAELRPDHAPADDDETKIRRALATIPIGRLRAAGVMDILLDLIGSPPSDRLPAESGEADSIDEMDTESLIDMVLTEADSDDLGIVND